MASRRRKSRRRRRLRCDHRDGAIRHCDRQGNGRSDLCASVLVSRRDWRRARYPAFLPLDRPRARLRPQTGPLHREDPIGFDGDTNLYAYVSNDPVNLIDPDGTFAILPILAGGLRGAEVGITAHDINKLLHGCGNALDLGLEGRSFSGRRRVGAFPTARSLWSASRGCRWRRRFARLLR